MNQQKSLKVNTILNIIKTGMGIAFPLITYPYISRVLLPENIGKVNFASSYVSYFSLIASLGISTYAIRECSKVRNNEKELNNKASQIFSINIFTTLIAYILLFFSLLFFSKLEAYTNLIIIQSTAIIFTTVGADWINSAMEDFLYITIRSIFFQLISLLLMFLFVKTSEDYIKYAAITVLSSSGANIVNTVYRRKYCHIRLTIHIQWKENFIPILFLFVMLLSQTILNSVDITMLGLYRDDYEVGIYSTAYKVVNIISQMVSSILLVLMPRLSYMFADSDYKQINLLLRKVLNVFLTIGIPCFAGAFVLAKEIIMIIGGVEYSNSVSVLRILLISFLLSLIGGSFLGNIILLPSGREKTYMIICCISTAVNIILNIFLIPEFGADAAAFTTAFSAALILIMLIYTKDKKIHIERLNTILIKPVIGSVGIIIFCLIIKKLPVGFGFRFILSVIGSVGLYGISQILLKNEVVIDNLENIIRKR